jgi:hypothetical protein
MEAMTGIAENADRYKCVVIAPLSLDDPFFEGISERDSIVHLFDDVRMLPYKKLRTAPAVRCLCLCGPGLSFTAPEKASGGNCCWFVAARWTEMLLGENDPFSANDPRPRGESVFSQDASFSCGVAAPVTAEAAAMGLTLFDRPPGQAALDKVMTVIGGEQAERQYASMLFNLVVNRAVRLAGFMLTTTQKGPSEAASVIQRTLRAELSAYGAISSDAQVTATPGDDGKITVTVDSDMTVSGYPVRFSFSL